MASGEEHPPGAHAVLIVDDDPSLRALARELLEDEGFRVLEADCAQAALAVLKRHAHATSVVMTDVQMPGPIDGVMLAEIIAMSWPGLMTLVTSGAMKAPDLPATACFLPKPWRLSDLLGLVETLASRSGTRPEPAFAAGGSCRR